MRKIINGKMYNTDTAEEICHFSSGQYGDFGYIRETLYKKKTGEFFLESYGGNLTSYQGETVIEPITEGEAKDFVERNGDVEKYIELFGEVEE